MDYQAIIEALDARTLEAFKAWGETFAKGMADALGERDAIIKAQGEQIHAMTALLGEQDERLTKALAEVVGAAREVTQNQIREALKRAPIPTYKGVFDRGADYQAGDMVTHKGSVWHCNAALAGEAPGASDAWTLAVKCGRDGRDGKDAAAQTSGEPA